MTQLDKIIRLQTGFTRSINLQRDSDKTELIQAYLPTAKSLQTLAQFAQGINQNPTERALALIGPYGSGKSAFALFLSALLTAPHDPKHQAAMSVLHKNESNSHLASSFTTAAIGKRGFLNVLINGAPSSLSRQLLQALALALTQQNAAPNLSQQIQQTAEAQNTPTMKEVIGLFNASQNAWAQQGGTGVLLEIDELGKFLEYEAYHPQNREIHLLQLLAEHAQQAHAAPLHIVVMLHQSFEHYTHRLSKQLRDEWQKIQGRYHTLTFIEPAEQSLQIIAAFFKPTQPLTTTCKNELTNWIKTLNDSGALPNGLSKDTAIALFNRCYPLHPITALILPVLCQKVAQNERTLFSYLASQEPHGLRTQLAQMQPGDWIKPAELYDYFMLNHPGGFSDPLVYHRWIEMVTALERLDAEPKSTEIGLLKTIGLLNMIGAQRGLKASDELLFLIYGAAYENAINRLITASAINYRIFNKEYRIWQGTDFNLSEKVSLASSEFEQLSLADTLNNLAPFKPIVARRATIETGSLRSFQPLFTSQNGTVRAKDGLGKPRIVFYLCEANEEITNINIKNPYDILALCTLTEHLREAVIALLALQSLPKSYAALQHDPVAEREYREWLQHAQTETDKLLRSLLEEPETLTWKTQNEIWPVRNRRELQERLSAWMTNACYTQAPLIRNELINWDKPSASANSGRKRLINAMLNAADQPNLGIEKTPAEMSLYLSLLKATGLHRKQEDRWGFYTPRVTNPDNEDLNNKSDPYLLSPLFEAITECLTTATNKVVELTQIYQKLTQPPYGIKLGVLPIFIVAYLQTNRREVALYQEGIFCDAIGDAQAEMLCRRPEYFALERFELTGLRGELFNQYMSAIVGKLPDESTLLDIVKPLIRFINSLPYYSLNSKSISSEANQVRIAFAAAQSPGTLLFETLPLACGIAPETFKAGESEAVTQFIERLVAVLRELKNCYPQLLNHLTQQISQALLDKNIIDLAHLRQPLIDNYQDLHNYTPDKIGLGAFIKRLTDQNFQTDQAWLESVATLLAQKPAQKWTDENRIQAEVRLKALGQQLRDLEKLRLAVPQANDRPGKAMLIKVLDSERGEISRIIQMPEAEQQVVTVQANDIAQQLNKMTASQQLAVIATLFERYTNSVTKEISHD